METQPTLWQKWWRSISRPQPKPEAVEQALVESRGHLPIPLIWLLGKTQSGKTSIIRALTGSTDSEIGSGVRPCTRTARLYTFPSEEDGFVRFLDTRGLGEANYDPSEDIAQFQHEAHLLLVVMKAMDLAQEAVVRVVHEVRLQRPQWPILVAQTCLHEGYERPDAQHLLPYPFAEEQRRGEIPSDLSRALATQRNFFADLAQPVRFVPLDITQEDDGYYPTEYGLDALWDAIEELLPVGLKGMLAATEGSRSALNDLYRRTAQPHVIGYALAAGGAAAIPVPWIDLPMVFAIQAKMFHAVASIYQQPMNNERMKEILALLGLGGASRVLGLAGRELVKGVPGLGSAAAGLYNAATTYALGMSTCLYFERLARGQAPDATEFRQVYHEHLFEGQTRLKQYLQQYRPWRSQNGDVAP